MAEQSTKVTAPVTWHSGKKATPHSHAHKEMRGLADLHPQTATKMQPNVWKLTKICEPYLAGLDAEDVRGEGDAPRTCTGGGTSATLVRFNRRDVHRGSSAMVGN